MLCWLEEPCSEQEYHAQVKTVSNLIQCCFWHCVNSVRIRSFSGSYFPSYGLNTDQKNAEKLRHAVWIGSIWNILHNFGWPWMNCFISLVYKEMKVSIVYFYSKLRIYSLWLAKSFLKNFICAVGTFWTRHKGID